MNRSLVIPAGCCLFAFAVLLATLHGAVSRGAIAEPAQSSAPGGRGVRGAAAPTLVDPESDASQANGVLLLSAEDGEQVLTSITGEYMRPWRQWEASPRRLYSRAAPRPIPTIAATVGMPPGAAGQGDSFLVATIDVRIGSRSEQIPCVVDRVSKQVRLFADGQWLTEEEWLKKAPLP